MAIKEKIPALILDSSVALAWCFSDEADTYADDIARALPVLHVIVPPLWFLEVANALLMGERRKRSLPSDTMQWIAYLRSLPISVDEETPTLAWSETLALARTHHLSVYDATYLALAQRRGLPVATLDKTLQKAAKKAGVNIYRPR